MPRPPSTSNGSTTDTPSLTLGTSLEKTSSTTKQRHGLVTLRGSDLMLHKVIVGLTGSGKSVMLATLFLQLLNLGFSCLLIDPHGDLCHTILALLIALGYFKDARAFDRLLYVPFAGDHDRYIAFNPLAQPYERHAIARHVMEAWQRAWPALAGGAAPVVENIVLCASYALCCAGLPLTALERFLTDAPFRAAVLAYVDDEQVLAFFTRYDASSRRSAILSESTLRRALLINFALPMRFGLGQRGNRLQLADLMQRGVSVLCNLGGLDEESKRFLGCLLTVELEIATLARASLPPAQRPPVWACIDEFPVFATQSAAAMEHLLAQARKFSVSLALSLQAWGQARKLQASLQNSTLISFRLGPDDSAWAVDRLFALDVYRLKERKDMRTTYMSVSEQRELFAQQLMTLPPREAYARLGGETVHFRTLLAPTTPAAAEAVARIEAQYAQRLLVPRPQIERDMAQMIDRLLADQPPTYEERDAHRTASPAPARVVEERSAPTSGATPSPGEYADRSSAANRSTTPESTTRPYTRRQVPLPPLLPPDPRQSDQTRRKPR